MFQAGNERMTLTITTIGLTIEAVDLLSTEINGVKIYDSDLMTQDFDCQKLTETF